ncbi:MAG: polyprenyl synthetase family protein [Thermoleophilia bacterium]
MTAAEQLAADSAGALASCELRLREALDDGGPRVTDPALTTLAAGGKRVRVLLVLSCAGQRVEPTANTVRAAAAVELVHMATLVHDDLLDGATMRRGRETVASAAGPDAAVRVGDFIFARAFRELTDAGSPVAVRLLAHAASELSLGELAQGRAAFDAGLTMDRYLARVRQKTASLFEASCRIGALIGGASPAEQDEVGAFGAAIGMAFQIFDDILDITGDTTTMGKRRGADLRDGTITLPMILALQDPGDLPDLLRERLGDDDVEAVCERLATHPATARAREYALDYVATARAHLDDVVEVADTEALLALADGVVDRYS